MLAHCNLLTSEKHGAKCLVYSGPTPVELSDNYPEKTAYFLRAARRYESLTKIPTPALKSVLIS